MHSISLDLDYLLLKQVVTLLYTEALTFSVRSCLPLLLIILICEAKSFNIQSYNQLGP